MDGYQVAANLHLQDPGKDAIIVAPSGYDQEGDRKRSREAGFDHHLVKPVEFDDLLAILKADGPPIGMRLDRSIETDRRRNFGAEIPTRAKRSTPVISGKVQ